METTHFFALIPMIIFLVISLVYYGKGLIHLTTLGYTFGVAYVAILNNWELLFFIPIVGIGIISLLLFCFAMTKGGWL